MKRKKKTNKRKIGLGHILLLTLAIMVIATTIYINI